MSSGVVLVDTDTGYQSHSGPKIIHYDSTRRQFSTRYLDGSGSLHIVVDSTDSDDAIDPANRVVLEGGSCASDEYCTLRLGTYSNAPKIITLNETGKTISGVPIR